MIRRSSNWTDRDTDSAATLTLPLLLILERDNPKPLEVIACNVGKSSDVCYRALRLLSSRGLAHRRERCYPAKMRHTSDGWEVKTERVICRWIISERGAAHRDRLIHRGDLDKLPERYKALAQIYQDRLDTPDGSQQEVGHD